ncbi:MAG: hypothetical protein WCR85_07900, partial [Sphaerochaeta sp.]
MRYFSNPGSDSGAPLTTSDTGQGISLLATLPCSQAGVLRICTSHQEFFRVAPLPLGFWPYYT